MTSQQNKFGLRQWAETATIFIAVIALVVSVWSAYETRKHNRLSVKPSILVSGVFTDDLDQSGILVSNNGSGPAFINKFEVYIDSKILPSKSTVELGRAIQQALNISDIYLYVGVPTPGAVFKEGTTHKILGTSNKLSNLTADQLSRLGKAIPKIEFIVGFSSLYEEDFEYSRKGIVLGYKGH